MSQKSALIFLSALLFYCSSHAQFKNPEQYPVFRNYKHWGLYYANVIYNKATTTRSYGDYEMENLPAFSYSFGFEKMIYPERRWAFKTGVIMDVASVIRFRERIKPEDIYPEYEGYDEIWADFRFTVSIPFLVEVKKQLRQNIYFNLQSGLHIAIQQSGRFEYSHSFVNESETEERTVFAMYAENPDISIYPNLIISPGFYFTEDWGLVRANIIYQNTLINYYKGEYQFGNLLKSSPTRGEYKLSGDYIGVSFSFHFNKTAYKNLIR